MKDKELYTNIKWLSLFGSMINIYIFGNYVFAFLYLLVSIYSFGFLNGIKKTENNGEMYDRL
jgi:hypothetical protein